MDKGISECAVFVCLCVQVAEHRRAVDKMLEDKRAMYEVARAAEEQEAAARCAGLCTAQAELWGTCIKKGCVRMMPTHLQDLTDSTAHQLRLPSGCPVCRRAEEARHAAIIAEQRRKLLEQAEELAEFLPPGVFKDRQELETFKRTTQLRQQQASSCFGRN